MHQYFKEERPPTGPEAHPQKMSHGSRDTAQLIRILMLKQYATRGKFGFNMASQRKNCKPFMDEWGTELFRSYKASLTSTLDKRIGAWIELQMRDPADLKFVMRPHKAIEEYYTPGDPHWLRLQAIFKNIFEILTREFNMPNRRHILNSNVAGRFIFPLLRNNDESLLLRDAKDLRVLSKLRVRNACPLFLIPAHGVGICNIHISNSRAKCRLCLKPLPTIEEIEIKVRWGMDPGCGALIDDYDCEYPRNDDDSDNLAIDPVGKRLLFLDTFTANKLTILSTCPWPATVGTLGFVQAARKLNALKKRWGIDELENSLLERAYTYPAAVARLKQRFRAQHLRQKALSKIVNSLMPRGLTADDQANRLLRLDRSTLCRVRQAFPRQVPGPLRRSMWASNTRSGLEELPFTPLASGGRRRYTDTQGRTRRRPRSWNVRVCPVFGRIVQRDVNAARNMINVFLTVVDSKGERRGTRFESKSHVCSFCSPPYPNPAAARDTWDGSGVFLSSSQPSIRDDQPIPPRPGIGRGCGSGRRKQGRLIRGPVSACGLVMGLGRIGSEGRGGVGSDRIGVLTARGPIHLWNGPFDRGPAP
ncbi:hypothetical protein BDK51DRAFT_34138 [Blyttiomyces helicus]|uniref:Uncharacterized protein n=1 Tax=Blyttiomyces helicus TaxID=388810 RepID=A0A4P9WMB8_9FUNG|nr:hypothetical protein BDK51DRAFT_34138 [Blyttiomyces helicus]|eukprot:RKO93612.1 hypothetical protein BDK51DRAFT_34138 [Blyttiomyces helicus]